MTAVSRALGCLVLACAAACGGRSVDVLPDPTEGGSGPLAGSGGQAGSGQAGTAQGGSGLAGTAQGGSGVAGSSYGGIGQGGSFGGTGYGGSGGACSEYQDQSSWYVPVQVINKTSKTIYVGDEMLGCEAYAASPFQVQNGNGALLVPPSMCRTSCGSLLAGNDIGGCPPVCLYPSALTLKPGEVFETVWDGLFARQITLPSECGSLYSSCQQAIHVQPGSYTFSSLAGLDLDCSQTSGEPCNVCQPNPSGGCTTPAALIGGQRITAETQVYLDASYGVWGDAGTAAGPTPNGNVGAAPQPRAVQIVFVD